MSVVFHLSLSFIQDEHSCLLLLGWVMHMNMGFRLKSRFDCHFLNSLVLFFLGQCVSLSLEKVTIKWIVSVKDFPQSYYQ
jgi:hypothetical protein